MIWFILFGVFVVLGIAVMLAAGTSMMFDLGFKSENHKKTPPPVNAWDEDERDPQGVLFYGKCVEFKDEILEARLRIKARDPEIWDVVSYDGLKLRARFIPAKEMRAVVVMMHGYHTNPLHDFSLAVDYYNGKGIGCLMPYQRGHGDSEGKYVYYGTRERFDVVTWCDEVGRRYPGMPVILDGMSMGATSVLMAAGLDLPATVKGIVADCAFTCPREMFVFFMRTYRQMKPFPFLYTTSLWARIRAGFRMNSASTVSALKKNSLPLFLAHGEADTFVPHSMSVENYNAAKDVCDATFLSVPDADHGMSFLVDRKRYTEEVTTLLDKCLK